MQVDRAAANGASAGHRYAGHATTCDQRPEDERTGAHGLDDLVLGDRIGECLAANRGAMLRASIAKFDFGAHGGKQLTLRLDVLHLGDVFQRDFIFRQDGSRHARKCGVLSSGNTDCANERVAAAYNEFIHKDCLTPEQLV